ncbi:MAG: 2-hydroxychromene-2-carboxylate isomerase [Pigmentiphaga sp.]|nr:2-hydroxychromene-2-carboxylate isomerase [Pigmentiphaga sp.]
MTTPTLRYYLAPRSPWTYLGHHRVRQLAAKYGVPIELRPFDLGEIFPITGGLQLAQRSPQRQAYRLIEIERWSKFLNLPMSLQPRHFPMEEHNAARMILAALRRFGTEAALDLAGACLKAVWSRELNIADPATLQTLAGECGLPGKELWDASAAEEESYASNTKAALELGVFGAPWYEYRGESFWGQDRLDFLERAMQSA